MGVQEVNFFSLEGDSFPGDLGKSGHQWVFSPHLKQSRVPKPGYQLEILTSLICISNQLPTLVHSPSINLSCLVPGPSDFCMDYYSCFGTSASSFVFVNLFLQTGRSFLNPSLTIDTCAITPYGQNLNSIPTGIDIQDLSTSDPI